MNSNSPELRSVRGDFQKILRLYDFYVWLNLVWYGLIFLLGVLAIRVQLPPDDFDELAQRTLRICGGVFCLIGVIFFGISMKLKSPERTKAGWMIAFINICLGISTCILAPFCIFLAMKWNQVEFRDEFIRETFEL